MAATRLFIYRLLDQKKIGWLIIAIAAVCKSILVACFSNYEADKSFYLLLAKNISAAAKVFSSIFVARENDFE